MGLLGWLLGKPNKAPSLVRSPQDVIPAKQNRTDSKQPDCLTFLVDGPHVQEFTHVGMSVNLWIPKGNPDKVYIYHRDGPGCCLGVVPSQYSGIIVSHLAAALDYDAKIDELTGQTCKIRCRLFSKEETEHRKEEDRAALRKELTKAYSPKKPITLTLPTNKQHAVKVGDRLVIEFGDLDSYLRHDSSKRGPFSCQWQLKFLDQTGTEIGVLDHDKSTIQKILKAHFNSYWLDIEVSETVYHSDLSGEKERSNWRGYPVKLVITPYKDSTTSNTES